MDQKLCSHESVEIISHCSLISFLKELMSLMDALLGKDGIICDDVGWRSRFNKGSNGVDVVNIGHGDIMQVTGTNYWVATYHGALIGSFVIVVDGGRITQIIYFSIRR